MKKWILMMLASAVCGAALAQGMAFGVKGGLTLGFQKWNNYEREALPAYNVSGFLESLPGEDNRYSILGQLGYHLKGSRIRGFYREAISGNLRRLTSDTEFHNLSLMVGMRSAYDLTAGGLRGYYLVGVRGDYNLKYSFDQRTNAFNEEDVNQFTYGLSLGGGFEFPVAETVAVLLEFQVSPDLRPQVYYPSGKYFYTDFSGNQIPAGETRVVNTAFEVTVGFRFLRKVEYVE